MEAKGDPRARIDHARAPIRRVFGRGLVISPTLFNWTPDVPVIPASVFPAPLREDPARSGLPA